MADISTDIAQWSGTANSNSPTGATSVGTGLDDNLRAIQAALVLAFSAKGSDIASAATVDLSATNGLFHDITGTTTITSFGTVRAGIWKVLKFEGALTLTHNATSLILPGGANITTADGDMLMATSEGAGNWRVNWYVPGNGRQIGPIKFLAAANPYDPAVNGEAGIGTSTTNGLILSGQGSTADLALANSALAIALSIPTGTTNLDAVGRIRWASQAAPADPSANGEGSVGTTTGNGAILCGQGSSNDVSLFNRDQAIALSVPTGTTNIDVAGSLVWGTGEATLGLIVKRKTADESVTSSTTLQDDDHLTFSIAANEEWVAEFVLYIGNDVGATTGFKVAITTPAAATLIASATVFGSGVASGSSSTSGTAIATFTAGAFSGGSTEARVTVRVANGANAGSITLQWAQGTSSGTALTVKTGSHMIAHRIA